MTSVALIGGDGAGKTSIARHLIESERFKAKYLYMGISLGSSNRLLPTSRLAIRIKHLIYERRLPVQSSSRVHNDPYCSREFGVLWVLLRYLNRFAEAWFRQIISQVYQIRGNLVVYDRYFLYCEGILDLNGSSQSGAIERIYNWSMRSFYPRPTLVILLDAPVGTLYERKPDTSPQRLEQELEMYRREGALKENKIITVDASKPLEQVIRQVDSAVTAVL